MSEGIKSMFSIIIVMVFLFIVFRKRILPLLHKKKGEASGKSPGSALSPLHLDTSYDVLVVDVVTYDSYTDLGEDLAIKLTRKMNYILVKGVVLSTRYISVGSLLIVVIEWCTRD